MEPGNGTDSQSHERLAGLMEVQEEMQSTDHIDSKRLKFSCLEEGEIEDGPDETFDGNVTSHKCETNFQKTSWITTKHSKIRSTDFHPKRDHYSQRSHNVSKAYSLTSNENNEKRFSSSSNRRQISNQEQMDPQRKRKKCDVGSGRDYNRSRFYGQEKRERPQVASMSRDHVRGWPDHVGSQREGNRCREQTSRIRGPDLTGGNYKITNSALPKRKPSSTFSREELEHGTNSDDPFWHALPNRREETETRARSDYHHPNYGSDRNIGCKRKWHFKDDQGWRGPNKRHCYNDDQRGDKNPVFVSTDMKHGHKPHKSNQHKQRDLPETVSYLMRPFNDDNKVVSILSDRKNVLQSYLRSNEECPILCTLLSVLEKCTKANDLHKTCKLDVMHTLRTSKFFERKDVIEQLKEPDLSPNREDFIEKLLLIMDTMVHVVGLEERDASIALSLIKRSCEYCEDINGKLKNLIMKIEAVFSKKRTVAKVNYEKIETFAKTLPILPDIDSIRSREQVVIPKHQVTAGFLDELSYISYMYVLLREDFVRPLVMGIRSYIDHQEKRESGRFYNSDVRCYEDVRILFTSTTFENGIVWRIQLKSNFSKKSRMPSILQYGSLLCLSCDDFRTIHYATVANRDISMLRQGQIEIKFVDAHDVYTDMSFVMIESRAFYESCSHTLKYLKQVTGELEENGSLPMGKYLAHLTTEVDEPKYLEDLKTISFKSLMSYGNGHDADETDDVSSDHDELDNEYDEENMDVPSEAGKMMKWPSAEQLGLDTSQYEALQLVLTNEIALVQGPPGTGKTMMGVRIAEHFLANRKQLLPLWLNYRIKPVTNRALWRAPLLLVSYTNHALDQFLQLLLETKTMMGCLPKDVVRVGSRCEVENLQKFTLKEHRHSQRHVRQRNSFHSLKDRMRIIKKLKMINSLFISKVVHEQTLIKYNVIQDSHIWQLQNNPFEQTPGNDTILIEWLLIQQFRHSAHRDPDKGQQVSYEFDVDPEEVWAEDRQRLLDNEDDFIQDQEDVDHHTVYFQIPEIAVTHSILQNHPDFDDLSKEKHDRILLRLQQEIGMPDKMTYEEMCIIEDIWGLSYHDRWRLYRYWAHAAALPISERIHAYENEFNTESMKYIEGRNLTDLAIMKDCSIVAMTTTAAAKYTEVLKELAAPIVIIEEAAQVSEQHVLSTLSNGCQHLIMIGDHQQLKPAYNDYPLAKEYHTDVSLFERLVRNQFLYKQLEKQHRMRPEISALLVPHIYKKLEDDGSVFSYPDVRGMASNVFFISHNVPEDKDDQSLSHSNKFEAEYLSQLYRYLRLQGYKSTDITVLSMYKDQVRILRHLITQVDNSDITDIDVQSGEALDGHRHDENRRRGARITSVDNFQGEENKIILLSLVRSNKKGKIGHLSTENRVCVSLSRAKEGLYVIGNTDCIRKQSPLWEKIISKAENNGMCGKSLKLKCKNHPSLKMMISSPSEFEAFKDGGCSTPCTTRLNCGHACQRRCHTFDEEHASPCQKQCVKKCSRGHEHNMKCSQEVTMCAETVTVVLPTCGHEVETKCYVNISDVKCTYKCENTVSCGHACQRKCGERCNTKHDCNELVKVTGKCGHTNQVACCAKMSYACRVPCQSNLDCGHQCKGTCGKCHSGRLHVPCQMKCERKLICGHLCGAKCTQVCPPCTKFCEVVCKHSKCSDLCGRACTDCKERCSWECKHCKNKFKCTKFCHEVCNRERCNIPCRKRLRKCRHKCIGLQCEECICRRCSDPVNFEIFFGSEDDKDATFYRLPDCGHIFEMNALDQYMDMPSESLGMKVCPRCTTPIFKAERYNNVVKSCLHDIENVKKRYLSNEKEFKKRKNDLLLQIQSEVFNCKPTSFFFASHRKVQNIFQVDSLRMQVGFYMNVTKLQRKLEDHTLKDEKRTTKLVGELDNLLSWVCLERFRHSDQETQEFTMEMRRLRYCYRVAVLQETIDLKEDIPEENSIWVQETLDTVFGGSKLDETNAEQIEQKLTELETLYPRSGIGITDDERIMILKAMDFREKGHWYKCKNGHVYAIGDCGGATVESRCPECSETIGGGSHRLREDNSVAGEMDGASYSAWSEQANMGNYDI